MNKNDTLRIATSVSKLIRRKIVNDAGESIVCPFALGW